VGYTARVPRSAARNYRERHGDGWTSHTVPVASRLAGEKLRRKAGSGARWRGYHGYIVASLSIHAETKRTYEWDGVDDIEQQRIAPAPEWLLEFERNPLSRSP
jgi:hypothetical protein